MKSPKPAITAERLRELVDYDPDTGVFKWRVKRGPAQPGRVAGCLDKSTGYLVFRIDGELYLAHRLVFLFMNGAMPAYEVDHINGVRSDNRWSNLRDVVSRVNKENFRRPRADNTSGRLGVSWFSPAKLWRASIQVDKRNICLGYRKTKEEAAELYLQAKRKMHEGCTI